MKKKTILIIEDETLARDNLAMILNMEGYRSLTAADGREGVALALAEPPDLIVCDITMPGLDGYAVLQAVRDHAPTAATPFIFLTAKSDRRDLRSGMNLGADDYLTKPASASEVLAAIAARFERERLRPPAEFAPDFSSSLPLEALGLTPREAEVTLWVAQGKSNGEIGVILDTTEGTIKKHLQHIFEKLGLDSRHALTVQVMEILQRSAD